MSNPISYSIAFIKRVIPVEILQKTFIAFENYNARLPVSMDSIIRTKIIEERVMVDCNLVGGTEATIPLLGLPQNRIDAFNVFYTIPKTMTGGRAITRALSVSYGEGSLMGATNMGLRNSSVMQDAVSGVMAAMSPIPQVSTAYVSLVGENTVLIQDNMALPINVYLRCMLENDSQFSHLQTASYQHFAKLVEYATKAYIYVTNVVKMDKGEIYAGQELGRYKEIVDSYSDAQQNYEDHLNKVWRKVSLLNDYQASHRHLASIVGGQW